MRRKRRRADEDDDRHHNKRNWWAKESAGSSISTQVADADGLERAGKWNSSAVDISLYNIGA